MALEKITAVTGRAVCVPGNDIDTDRIIPARFMKCVTFDGLGEFLFHDVRKNAEGVDLPHPLNDPRFGFRAVVAESFAEIFFGNCTTLGIPCAAAARADIARLAAAIEADPALAVTLDVSAGEIRFGAQSIRAEVRPAARDALIHGRWDAIGELLEGLPTVQALAARTPYLAA